LSFYNVAYLVNETDIIIRTSDQLNDTCSIQTDANKTVTIDVYTKSVSEEIQETMKLFILEEPYVQFDYSAWFPNSTSEMNETDSKIYNDRVHNKIYIEIAGPENYMYANLKSTIRKPKFKKWKKKASCTNHSKKEASIVVSSSPAC